MQAVLFLVVSIIVVAATQLRLIVAGQTAGLPFDSDGWTRLLRVRELWNTGEWFPALLPHLSAPEGLSLHWTRPLDVLILGGAWIGVRVFGAEPDQAILLAGSLLCPLLYVGVVLAAGWAARIAWPEVTLAPYFALVALIGNGPLKAYTMLGRADHHVLVVLAALIGLGFALRAVDAARPARPAFAAGIAFGCGIWVVPEALIVAVPVCIAFGAQWLVLRDGTDAARQGLWTALGMAATLAVAILVERPAADWFTTEYDRVSMHHLVLALLMAAVFLGARRVGGLPRLARAATGGVLAAAAGGLLLWLYPGTMGTAMSAALSLPDIQEMRPIGFRTGEEWRDALVFVGIAPAAFIGLAAMAWTGRGHARWRQASLLVGPLLLTLLATLAHRRFGAVLGPVAALCAAGLIGLAARAQLGAVLRVPLMLGALLLLVPAVAGEAIPAAPADAAANGQEAGGARGCEPAFLIPWLQTARPAARAIVLTSEFDNTAELAWRTTLRFVAAPYHRGQDALADTVAFFRATDDAAAEAVLRRRQISYVLLCPGSFVSDGGFARRLAAGDAPGWLEPIAAPVGAGEARLWRVR